MAEKKEKIISEVEIRRAYSEHVKRLEDTNAQAQKIQSVVMETKRTIAALNSIKKGNDNSIYLLPLGEGLLIEAKIEKKEALKSTGTGIYVKKSIEEAIESLKGTEKDARKVMTQISENQEKIAKIVNNTSQMLRQIDEAKKKKLADKNKK